MKIALISDIHGNLTALKSALDALDTERVNQIVCLGDVAATGPQPEECVALLAEREIPCVRGNTDAWLLRPEVDEDAGEFMQMVQEIDLWCAAQLSEESRAYLAEFQKKVTIPLGAAGSLLCFHGSPKSYHDTIVATTPEEELLPLMEGEEARVFAGGHTHQPILRYVRDRIFINPGSVGLGYERAWQTNEPFNVARASYAVLAVEQGALEICFHTIPFDVEALRRAIAKSGMPRSDELLALW